MKGRRLISRAPRQIEVEEFQIPPLGADSILIENQLTGVSVGTEIHCWVTGTERDQALAFPRTTGYCSTGTVIDVGRNVTSVHPGDRVAAQGIHASHEVASSYCFPVPESVAPEDAVFLVMAAISMRGIRRGRVQLGEAVAIIGMGLVGQLALSLCRLSGAMPLIAIDLDQERLSRAGDRGADHMLNPAAMRDLAAKVRELCPEDGADVVVEATGKPAVYPTAVSLARTGGRVIGLGSPRGRVEMDFMADVHLREVDIVGAFQPATPEEGHIYYPWTKKRDRRFLLELMACGRLRASDLITHRAQPQECQAVYQMLADRPSEALGVVFEW
ncbi:MAG: zinc-binding alcohol dehydrogenase [Gemmatimonadota bacterium]